MVEINDVEKQLDKNWDDVELNAQRSQAGQLFKLRVCTENYMLMEKKNKANAQVLLNILNELEKRD